MRYSFLCLFLLMFLQGFTQYNVRLEITVPDKNKNDSFYLAGNINNWNPLSPDFTFQNKQEKLVLEKQLPAGKYAYKITRGTWDKVETGINGADINNRELHLTSDTVLSIVIAGWKDDFPPVEKSHTASANVHVFDTAFYMKKLNRYRKVWIYIPPEYKNGNKRFPVIYMHDGQNLFDNYTSAFGEWQIDEILDSLAKAGKPQAIVVGIESGSKRLNEYNPWHLQQAGDGEGDAYLDFIVKDLKPAIDKKYRTLPGKESTIIAGSSMGGLISYYAILKFPAVFGRTGVFSPAFWTAPAILKYTDSLAPKSNGMFFFYMGEQEGEHMVDNMDDVIMRLGSSSKALLYTIIDPDGKHNEAAWRKWFAEFYLWVNSNGLNHIIR